MKRPFKMDFIFKTFSFVLLSFIFIFYTNSLNADDTDKNSLGIQSTIGKGELRILVIAVKFPDVAPTFSIEQIQKKAVNGLNKYVKEQSYGLAWLNADFKGWINLPEPIAKYNISPYNFKVDRNRVRKLIEDTMTVLENKVDFSNYKYILIIPGAHTMPGKGYGMICYCANPGMLTGVKGKLAYSTLESKGGKKFKGGVFVGAENAHLGMFAHDFFHTLGGIYKGKRLVPCLYDYERQSDNSKTPSFEHHAIYIGAWDIMSEHFVKREEPPPGISSFTKIRLGWIGSEQAVFTVPGKNVYTFLSPLSKGGDKLVVKVFINDGNYYLIENRQPIGYDKTLPDSGIVIYKVNPDAQEGYGTVKLMDANPSSSHFSKAAYKLSEQNGNIFKDKKNGFAVIPLWKEGEKTGVLVTTIDNSDNALKAALSIQKILLRYPKLKEMKRNQLLINSINAFKKFDFKTSYQISQKIVKY